MHTLILSGQLFKESFDTEACIPSMDPFLSGQLPNDAFTAHYCRVSTEKLSKNEFGAIMQDGYVNLAENDLNVPALTQAILFLDSDRKPGI